LKANEFSEPFVTTTFSTPVTEPVVKAELAADRSMFNVSLPAPPAILSVADNVFAEAKPEEIAEKMSSAEPPTKLSVVEVVNAEVVDVASATEAATSAFQAVAAAP